jgi:hypothetical protein
MGLRPISRALQIDSMDAALRNGLWNACGIYWDTVSVTIGDIYPNPRLKIIEWQKLMILVKELWRTQLKKPLDEMDERWPNLRHAIKAAFYDLPWNEVYDFIEFLPAHYPDESLNKRFRQECNRVLEQEASGYRFITGKIAPIASEAEMTEVERAIEEIPLEPVHVHLQTGLKMLSDRQSRDYRNSIKESISAVEALCRAVANSPNASLSNALDEIAKGKLSLSPALKGAFEKLYGYTSSADGIRHAMMDESSLDFEDAWFMLVACSAFVNYLKSKATKAGIELKLGEHH